MKKQAAFVFLLLFGIVAQVCAQNKYVKKIIRHRLDRTTVVQDSSGIRYPYSVWNKMMMDGYSLRPVNPADSATAFIIYKMTDEQKQAMYARMPMPRESPFFITNKKFSFYKDKAIDGYKVGPDELAGKIVVFNFWFVNCPPCRREIPELNKLVEKYKDNPDVVFIAAALDGTHDIKKFLESQPFNYHILPDSRYLTARYRMNSFPTNVIIDKQGNVRFHTTGYGPNTAYWLNRTIEQLKSE